MRRTAAAAGSSVFFAAAPGVVAGVVPWGLTGWERSGPVSVASSVAGGLLVAAGAAVLVHAFARFVREGLGTPAPVAPTEHLVVGGLYRYLRNPMYVAVVTCVAGQALLLGRGVLWIYAAGLAALFLAFVRGYEEPALRRRFGPEYDAYQRAVPGWYPRVPLRRPPRVRS